MTQKEAIRAMKEGKKVRHEYFSPNEYLYMHQDGGVSSEDGVYWGSDNIKWRGTCLDPNDLEFQNGWSLYES